MRATLPPGLVAVLANRHGVVTTALLRSFGIGRRAQGTLVDSGLLQLVTRGCFVLATAQRTLEHRCAVLCALHPGGFVTGPTAGAFAGLRRMPMAALHFSVEHGRRLDPVPGVRFRQTTRIVSADRRQRPDGIVVASWARLAFDLAADLPRLDHLSVAHQMLERRLVTHDELCAVGRRLCHPGRRGSTTFQRTLDALVGVADSDAEVLLGEALRVRGVPVDAQVAVTPLDGIARHVDLGVRAHRWGVELDIHPEHRSVEGMQRDSHRRRQLRSVGWQIETFTERDLDDLDRQADELAALYRTHVADQLLRPEV